MSKILCIFTLLLALACGPVFSQKRAAPTYSLDWKKETPALAAGAGLSLAGPILEKRTTGRNGGAFSLQTIVNIDRSGNGPRHQPATSLSHWMLGSAALLPFSLLADADVRGDAGKVGVLLSETILLTNGLTAASRLLTKQDGRPAEPESYYQPTLAAAPRQAFFSGHTAAVASLSFFTAKVWTDYHADSRWKPAVWATAAALPAVTGYLRLKTGKQDLANVASGYLAGALVGFLVPQLHKEKKNAKSKLRLSSSFIGQTPVFVVKFRP